MANLAAYRNDTAKENLWYIEEDITKYRRLLDEATDQFNKELEALEKRCLDNSEDPDSIFMATENAISNMIFACEKFERGVDDKEVIKEARIKFRKKTDPVMSKSNFMNRTKKWPRGYQGDYETLEIIYRNRPVSEGIGYYLDLHFLDVTLADGVRKRIKKLEEILRGEIGSRKKPSILNVACGSCRELMGLVPAISASGANVVCVDHDDAALEFAQRRLSYTEILPQIEFRKYNTLRMFDPDLNMMEFGTQDIIYSVGHFDYLDDDFLMKMLKAFYLLLNPGGKLIAAFKDVDYYETQTYHWFADWDGFLQRTEGDFDRLVHNAGIPDGAIAKTHTESDAIIFYTITK